MLGGCDDGLSAEGPGFGGWVDDGHEEGDLGAAAGAADDVDGGEVAVEDCHAFAYVAHADSGAGAYEAAEGRDVGAVGGHADSVVFYFDEKSALVGDLAAQGDGAAADAWFEAVLDAVFDEGLEKHAGDDDVQGVVGDFFDDFEFLAEAYDFDVEVIVGEG